MSTTNLRTSPANYPPTPEQQAIITSISPSSGNHSVMVEAGAGCAKTTVLEMAAPQIKSPALAVAFNKSIATELGSRLPGNFTCKTMNSLGHSAFARATGLNLKLDDRKIGRLISEVSKSRRLPLSTSQWDSCRQLVREAQIQGLVPTGHGPESLVEDTPDGWRSLQALTDLDSDDFELVWEIARETLVDSIRLSRQGLITFDDQIYCSTLISGIFGRFPYIFLDEDQDLNPLQIRMVTQSLRPDTRILAVGDTHQSVYAFRGAVGEAAQQLKLFTLRPGWQDLPLMTSFRVPHLVADRQRAHVPLFRAHGTNSPGRVLAFSQNVGWSWSTVIDNLPDPHTNLAVLCRNNAPLLSLAFKLIRQGIGVKMLGRDIGRGLATLVKKLAPDDSTPSQIVRGRLEDWQVSETSKILATAGSQPPNPDQLDKTTDRAECILAVLDSTEARDAGQLRRQIEALFARESGLVTLSSIHRAKGLEFPAVFLLDPWRIAGKRAQQAGGRVLEQELNLRYVAETRTKHTLILGSLEGFQL